MTRKTLYLHVGTHKTGSTSFQHFLMDHRDDLAARGLAVFPGRFPRRVGPPRPMGNAWLLVHAFLRPDLMSTMRLKERQGRCGSLSGWPEKARLEKFVAVAPQDRLLVSSEAFCLLRTGPEAHHLRSYLARLGCDVVPILVERDIESWRRSNENQLARMRYDGPELDGLPETQRMDGAWYYDIDAIVAFWGEIGSLVRLDYTTEMAARESIIPAMMAALGLPDAEAGAGYRLNVRKPPPDPAPA